MERTTMTLEPDVAEALKRRAKRTGQPFRRNVNEVIRLGLKAEKARPSKPYRLKPVSLGGVAPGIDLTRALALSDTLEDEALVRKLELRK
ncbi:MAG: DUF2191 domain-containing protein [Vicinamibacteria bacterium]